MTAAEVGTARSLLAINHTRLFSGAERVLARMLEAAVDDGWTVSCCAPEGPLTDRLRPAVAIEPIPELKPSRRGRIRALAGLAVDEVRAASTIRAAASAADVVVVNGLMALPAVAMARPAAPVCWLVHDVPVRRDLRTVARLAAPFIDAALAPSNQAAAFPRRLRISTTVSANGTPMPSLTPPSSSNDTQVVGCSAAITRWKGQHVLLDAMARIPDVPIEIMGMPFPGDEPYEAELRRRADEPDLVGRVRFLGHLAQPFEQMRSWSICVSPSVEPEAGSLVLLEAMSLGLPIVATDHGCAVEYLGPAGVLVPPRDTDALAIALRDLLGDPDRARRLGAAARARAEAEFTLERSRDRFLEAMTALAGNRARR